MAGAREVGDGSAAIALTARQGDATFITYVSTRGVATTQFGPAGTPVRGGVVDYTDGTTLGLDFGARTYVSSSLTAMVQRRLADLATFRSAASQDGVAPPPVPTPTIVRTRLKTRIAGISARAYDIDQGDGHAARVWYAQGLPLPPPSFRLTLAALTPAVTGPHAREDDPDDDEDEDGHDGAASGRERIAGRQVLRVEALSGDNATIVLDTESARRVRIPASTFAAPVGWRSQPLTPLPSGPVGPAFDGGSGTLSANVSNAGVTAAHPEIYLFYWGKSFTDPVHSFAMQQVERAIEGVFTTGYTSDLLSYGINLPVLMKTLFDHTDPPFAIGGDAVGAYAGLYVLAQSLSHGDLPRFWWEVGGHDPIYAILVPEDVVESGRWDGFHFMVHTFADAYLPFPVNLFTHIGMPYLIARVPAAARDHNFFLTASDRVFCAMVATSPSKCVALAGLDDATARFSHELVEASTDPEPFLGISDLIRNTDVASYGEIADICEDLPESQPYPFASRTLVGNVAVSTYWQQSHERCVPATQPAVTITSPAAGTPIPWEGPLGPIVPLNALVHDPAIGDLPGTECVWTIDDVRVAPLAPACVTNNDCPPLTPVCSANLCVQQCGPGLPSCRAAGCEAAAGLCTIGLRRSLVSPPLSLGGHAIRAVYTSNVGTRPLSAQDDVVVFVTAFAPTVTIDSPTTGAFIPADQFATLRGTAIDPQDGVLRGPQVEWSVNGADVGIDDVLAVQLPGPGDALIAFTARNSAGLTATATVTVHVTAPTGLPSVTIVTPHMNQQFLSPDEWNVSFVALARDADGSTIPDAKIEWTDDVDGPLGTGASITHVITGSLVGPVQHTVTVKVTGAHGTSADSVAYSVGEVG